MNLEQIAAFAVYSARVPTVAGERIRPGCVHKIVAILLAWWVASKRPPDVPEHLRADLGLPPSHDPAGWWDHLPPPGIPHVPRRRADHE